MRKMPRLWNEMLVDLLKAEPKARYDILKSKAGYRSSTVSKAVNRLLEQELIGPVGKRQEKKRPGRTIDQLGLTLMGLGVTVSSWPGEVKDWSKLASVHKGSLPVPLGNWEYFRAEGVEELAQKSFVGFIRLLMSENDWGKASPRQKRPRR